jgi:Ser/Thr protein kinase RdoA (MazF antagonist)
MNRQGIQFRNNQEGTLSPSHRFPKGRYGIRTKADFGVEDRLTFPAQSSVMDEEALLERVIPLYVLPPISSCWFLTRGDADVYRMEAVDGRRFFLKVYRPPRTVVRAEAEGQLAADLVGHGFPAVPPVQKSDGRYATAIDASEGVRPVLLWSEAPPPLPEMTPVLAEALGRTVAQLHKLADSLPGRYALPADITSDVPEVLSYALALMNERDGEMAVAATEWVCSCSMLRAIEALECGICHGDLATSNIRLHPVRGVTLFDFGDCQYVWRGCDFMRFVPRGSRTQESEALWQAFRRGYCTIRELPRGLDEMLPVFRLKHHLRSIGYAAASCSLRLGWEAPEGWLSGDVQALRNLARAIPGLSDRLAARDLL